MFIYHFLDPDLRVEIFFEKEDVTEQGIVDLEIWDYGTSAYRSSHRRCSVRKDVLRNFAKFTGKHQYQRLFFNKVAGTF